MTTTTHAGAAVAHSPSMQPRLDLQRDEGFCRAGWADHVSAMLGNRIAKADGNRQQSTKVCNPGTFGKPKMGRNVLRLLAVTPEGKARLRLMRRWERKAAA